jgi:hypothetical protein
MAPVKIVYCKETIKLLKKTEEIYDNKNCQIYSEKDRARESHCLLLGVNRIIFLSQISSHLLHKLDRLITVNIFNGFVKWLSLQ